jgi:putative FmdB family regulatory protein
MPTYEYQCNACGHEFERFESIKAQPNNQCPKCSKKKGERQISGGGGLIFKGSGFYCTDYKKSSSTSSPNKSKKEKKAEPCTASCPAAGSSDCPASKG